MKNKRVRDFMDRYPEFMLVLTILTILFIVFSTSVSPESHKNASPDKVTATTTTSNLRAGYGPYSTSNCYYRCTDSDGGSIYERGQVSIVSPSGCPTTTMRHFQDYCIDETTLMEYECDKENRYHTQKQVNCECINGACIPVREHVDVTVTPSVKYVSVSDKAIYKIKIKDKHPVMRCITIDTDDSNTEEARCHIYYTYKISVSGLPFTADYPKEVTLYQGSTKTVELTIQPEYRGRFMFTVTATQKNDRRVTDSDSATLVVNGYTSCDEACRGRGYDYGVCRTSCSSDERNIGTRYCIQQHPEPILVKNVDVVPTADVKSVTVNATATTASSSGGGGMGVAIAETSEVPAYRPIYCCCGVRELKVKAWTNKNTYKSGETAGIYAKVAYTDESNVDAEVYGTVTKPDGSEEDITFRQICAIQEIRDAVTDVEKEGGETDSIETEIHCASGICSPRCIYVASYENTETEGRYTVTVYAETPGGEEAQTETYFSVRKPHTTCNDYCQKKGFDYGICRTSCSDEEYDAGSEYCPQIAIAQDVEKKAVSPESGNVAVDGGMYPIYTCCCGKLVPPPPPERIKLHLKRGWNLITMPGKGELDKGTCERMYGFVYIDGRYYTMKEAEEKLGSEGLMEYLRMHSFWVYTFKSCYLEFSVEDHTSHSEVNLERGWNFVPVTYDMKSITLYDIKGDCVLDEIYMWNPEKQSWERIDGDYVFKESDLYHGFISHADGDCSFSQTSLTPPPLPGGD